VPDVNVYITSSFLKSFSAFISSREFNSAFSIGSNYPDDPRWSPDVEHGYFHKPNLSTDPEGSAANPILIEPRVSDPVSSHQVYFTFKQFTQFP
jgi:hypothetical protein